MTASAVRPPLANAWQASLTPSLAALGFFLPFSTAGTSLAMLALLLLCLASPLRVWHSRPWRQPVLLLGLVLLLYIALRVLAEGAWSRDAGAVVNRYHELLMIPLLWALMQHARRPHAFLWGLAAGAITLAAMHWIAPLLPALGEKVASRRISAGFALSVCAFLLYEYARLGRFRKAVGYPAAALMAATVLFASDGRTGHVVLLVLLACAAWRSASGRWRWPVMLGIVATTVLIASTSTAVRTRMAETLSVAQAQPGAEQGITSTGIRVELLRTGAVVAEEHLAFGTGWTRYPQAFEQAALQRPGGASGPWARSDNPHNEYLLQLGAGGLPALLLFLGWVALPLLAPLRGKVRDDDSAMLACVALAFAVGCLFNSLLLDFTEGHLYGAVLAWLLARRDAARAT